MKILITYEECLWFKLEKEVEMTAAQYKNYLKNGADTDLLHDLENECGLDHFQEREIIRIDFDKIK